MSSTKEYILTKVRSNRPSGSFPYPGIPMFPQNTHPVLEEFKQNLVIGGGTWYEMENKSITGELIEEILPGSKVICSAVQEFKGTKILKDITDPHSLADVDVGIIRASFGVAENGMVWLSEEDLGVISLGFLSQHLIILLNPNEIVKDMHEAYKQVHLDTNNYGCFMLGPSATADIGAYMVHGAQGARSLTVFFM